MKERGKHKYLKYLARKYPKYNTEKNFLINLYYFFLSAASLKDNVLYIKRLSIYLLVKKIAAI